MNSDSISIERLNQLHPLIRNDAILSYNESISIMPVGVKILITQTMRSFEESAHLYAQGRTEPGSIVTKAQAGQSYHNYGLGIDFVLLVGGKMIWKVDENWMTVVNIFKKYGFKWGGDWKGKFKDYPHLEKTLGHNWRDLLVLHNTGKVDEQGYVLI